MRPDYCPLWNEPCQKGCEPKCGSLNAWEKLREENGRLREALLRARSWAFTGKGYDSGVAEGLRRWIDAGMDGPLPPVPEYLTPF